MLRKKSKESSNGGTWLYTITKGQIPKRPISSIFSSPRLINAFASKGLIDAEAVLSPTSILDTKPEIRTHWEKLDSRKFGLGILDALIDEKPNQPDSIGSKADVSPSTSLVGETMGRPELRGALIVVNIDTRHAMTMGPKCLLGDPDTIVSVL
ncbi:hypothetical protein C3L33_23257, partial [Rhododendron williamsianum]